MGYTKVALPGFDRFSFVAEALDACGGFKPRVIYLTDENFLTKPVQVSGPCYLIPYPRESMTKFAARAAVAVYENHLRSACNRFVGYITRKPPQREGADGPLTSKFLDDADWCGNALDVFFGNFMIEAKARGSMLLLMDMPKTMPGDLATQVAARALPYISAIKPEQVAGFDLNEQGQFERIGIRDCVEVGGEEKQVVREWDAAGWRVLDGEKVVEFGTHPFGRCPVLAFTEHGKFPCFGAFEQIADLSRRIYNAQSELDEILRSQTFSLLTMQVPKEAAAAFDPVKVSAVIGTHNMATYQGERPGFIAPGDGPAKVYMERISGLEERIRQIGMEIEEANVSRVAESGFSRALRFQALNGALSAFATRMQDFERQIWDLFAAAVRTENRVVTTWATDYTLADITGELDKLTLMQSTGFSDAVLVEKRKQIVHAEFTGLDADSLQELLDSLDEPMAEPEVAPVNPNSPGGASGTAPSTDSPDAGDPASPGDPSAN